MSSKFFIRKSKKSINSSKVPSKRKAHINNNFVSKKKKDEFKNNNDTLDSDEISSDEENLKNISDVESGDDFITAQEKKVNLAKKYLEEVKKEEEAKLDSGDIQASVINRLREELLDQTGKLTKKIADQLCKPEENDLHVLRCKEHKLSITCAVVSLDGKVIYSGSKDAMIVKWSVEHNKKLGIIYSKHKEKDLSRKEHSHCSSILSLAISKDTKYLASSDASSVIRIWNADSLIHVHSFKGHRSSVTGLAFCHDSNNLYSCSNDRSVRVWSLDEMCFVEALFGHQCGVTDIDVLRKDRVVTAGGTDNTIRVWKIQEESQLIFNGHNKSIDKVQRIDHQHFVSCGVDGQLCLWGILKKKPLSIIHNSHGIDASNNEPNWITSVSCFPNSDLIISGSNDGHLRFWKCGDNFRNITPLFSVPVIGFINSISFSKDGSVCVIGIGQEHRLGRWFKEQKAKNSLLIVKLNLKHSEM